MYFHLPPCYPINRREKEVRVMGILVALIGVAIIAAVVVASFTAVLGGVIGGELEDEEE